MENEDNIAAGGNSLTLPAKLDCLPEAQAFVRASLNDARFDERFLREVALVVEELFVNIARYAYVGGDGSVTLQVLVCESTLQLVFTDRGVPYDPLSREEPDITASLEERPIGGLGIYLVKRLTDRLLYTREDGCNQLWLWKTRRP